MSKNTIAFLLLIILILGGCSVTIQPDSSGELTKNQTQPTKTNRAIEEPLPAAFNATDLHGGQLVIVRTEAGDFKINLFRDKAPESTAYFLKFIQMSYFRKIKFFPNYPTNIIMQTSSRVSMKLLPSAETPTDKATGRNITKNDVGYVIWAIRKPVAGSTQGIIAIVADPHDPKVLEVVSKRKQHKNYKEFLNMPMTESGSLKLSHWTVIGKVVEGMDVVNTILARALELVTKQPMLLSFEVQEDPLPAQADTPKGKLATLVAKKPKSSKVEHKLSVSGFTNRHIIENGVPNGPLQSVMQAFSGQIVAAQKELSIGSEGRPESGTVAIAKPSTDSEEFVLLSVEGSELLGSNYEGRKLVIELDMRDSRGLLGEGAIYLIPPGLQKLRLGNYYVSTSESKNWSSVQMSSPSNPPRIIDNKIKIWNISDGQ